jgi:hypothetical protein
MEHEDFYHNLYNTLTLPDQLHSTGWLLVFLKEVIENLSRFSYNRIDLIWKHLYAFHLIANRAIAPDSTKTNAGGIKKWQASQESGKSLQQQKWASSCSSGT